MNLKNHYDKIRNDVKNKGTRNLLLVVILVAALTLTVVALNSSPSTSGVQSDPYFYVNTADTEWTGGQTPVYDDIRTAISDAADWSLQTQKEAYVLVTVGHYSVYPTGHESPIPLENGVTIIGGFSGAESGGSTPTPQNPNNPDDTSANTSFRGNLSGTMFVADGVDSTAELQNIVISYGLSTSGGGIYITNGGCPTIEDCTFYRDFGNGGNGGGMYNDDSSPTLKNCNFIECGSYSGYSNNNGGGIYNTNNSSPILTDCTFTGNAATDNGGGIYNTNNSSPILTDCSFTDNGSYYFDDGYSIYSCYTDNGGGMYSTNGSSRYL